MIFQGIKDRNKAVKFKFNITFFNGAKKPILEI
jgi:hypothetical protein